MEKLKLFNVNPKIPEQLSFLDELSFNIWWCWNYEAIELFRRIDISLWRAVHGNSRLFLNLVSQEHLEELAHDKGFLEILKSVEVIYRKHVKKDIGIEERRTAYFSLEYGIHESLRLYSGGLGVLAGDHLKAASDLNLPIVSVGLLYRQGYFKQQLDSNGYQNERYPENELNYMPVTRAKDKDGNEVNVKLRLLDREVTAAVWKMDIGNIPLILLDTEIPENPPDFKEITWRLYGGDKRMRLHQELLLGIGGFQALIKMGYVPSVCHMNEGHAAFLSLARIAYLMQTQKVDFDTAVTIVWRSNIFTTHTPVPAGNEVFEVGLLKPYLEVLMNEMGIDVNRVLNWGMPPQNKDAHEMSMTILGLRMANFTNGVSRLHGEVARKMWKDLWPERPIDEIPISHITNGVHVASWIAERNKVLFDHYLSPGWMEIQCSKKHKTMIDNIPDEELWHTHEMCRLTLVRHARNRLKLQMRNRNASSREAISTKNILNQDILTIGFARRFATYKRASLLLQDPDRLRALLTDPERPVQIIFAGKAHPADEAGKHLIQEIINFSYNANVRHRMVFLEDYDINLARYLVQGVDVWLNTPLRPQEASGTSGMKAAINGVLNCSILDGWWVEGYSPDCGWSIPTDDSYDNNDDRDRIEAQALYNIIENDIIPTFYDRSEGDLPQRWVRMMKESIKMGLGSFSSIRMVNEYYERFYGPALRNYDDLMKNDAGMAVKMVASKRRYDRYHDQIYIENPQTDVDLSSLHVCDKFKATAKVYLGELKPDDVDVEIYYGPVDSQNQIKHSNTALMTLASDLGNGNYLYEYELTCNHSGRFGLTARVTPVGHDWDNSIPGFIKWAE